MFGGTPIASATRNQSSFTEYGLSAPMKKSLFSAALNSGKLRCGKLNSAASSGLHMLDVT